MWRIAFVLLLVLVVGARNEKCQKALEVSPGITISTRRLLSFVTVLPKRKGDEKWRKKVNDARVRCQMKIVGYEATYEGFNEFYEDCFHFTDKLTMASNLKFNDHYVEAALKIATIFIEEGCISCPCLVNSEGECIGSIGELDELGICSFTQNLGLAAEESVMPSPALYDNILPSMVAEEVLNSDVETLSKKSKGEESLAKQLEDLIAKPTKKDFEEEPRPSPALEDEDESSEMIKGEETDSLTMTEVDEPYESPEPESRWLSAGRVAGIAAAALGLGTLILVCLCWAYVKFQGRE